MSANPGPQRAHDARPLPERNPAMRTAARPSDLLVPIVDAQGAERIHDPSILQLTLAGALIGAVLLGWLAFAIAAGGLPIAGLGQFSAAGAGAATFTGAGIGVALGGLVGGLVALYRLPPRRPMQHEMHGEARDEMAKPGP